MNLKKIFSFFNGGPKRYPQMPDSIIYKVAFSELPKIVFGDPNGFIAVTQGRRIPELGDWTAAELNLGKMAYIIEFNGSRTPAAMPASAMSTNKAILAGAVIDPHDSDATEYFVLVSSPTGRVVVRQVYASLSSGIKEGVDSLPDVDSFAGLLKSWRTPVSDVGFSPTNISNINDLEIDLDPSDYSQALLDLLSEAKKGDKAAMYGAAITILTGQDGPVKEDVAIVLLASAARLGNSFARMRLESILGIEAALVKILAGKSYNWPRG